MGTSKNYVNVKPSVYLPLSSDTEDEGREVSETFETHNTVKCLIAREKLITLKLTYWLQILLAGTTKV